MILPSISLKSSEADHAKKRVLFSDCQTKQRNSSQPASFEPVQLGASIKPAFDEQRCCALLACREAERVRKASFEVTGPRILRLSGSTEDWLKLVEIGEAEIARKQEIRHQVVR